MKRAASHLAWVALGVFTQGCGMFAAAPPSATVASTARPVATPHAAPLESKPADPRKLGDFRVHRFSGSYRKSPLSLTEEVIAREGGCWVIDYTFEESSGTTKFRVRFDPETDSVRRVSKIDGRQELSVPISSFEKLIERTSFAADSSDGPLSSTRGSCLVGPSELDCETKSDQVAIGDDAAILNVSRSSGAPGEDVAGDVMANDGAVIYWRELIEMGNLSSPKRGLATR